MHFNLRISAVALMALGIAATVPAQAESLSAADWTDSSTDSGGNYSATPAATQNGSGISGIIFTNAVQNAYINSNQFGGDPETVSYLRTGSDGLVAGSGDAAVLGNLSSYAALTATFNITNSTLSAGDSFLTSQLVGEPGSGEGPANAALRLTFTGAGTLPSGDPSVWYSNPIASVVTQMLDADDITLTVAFDPSQWSNIDGVLAVNDTADFNAAVAKVTRAGLAFGSGFGFSDGFAFNTGGTASLNLEAIDAVTPEPGTLGMLFCGALVLVGAARKKFAR